MYRYKPFAPKRGRDFLIDANGNQVKMDTGRVEWLRRETLNDLAKNGAALPPAQRNLAATAAVAEEAHEDRNAQRRRVNARAAAATSRVIGGSGHHASNHGCVSI